EIDERAVIGDVLDDTLEDLALGQRLERVLLLLGVLLLEERLARQHDVAALLVDLDDAHPQLLAAQRVEVAHWTNVDLRAGQECAHADVDRQAALDPLDDAADHDLALGIGLLDLIPDLHLLGFFAREDDIAIAIFGPLEQHVDNVAGLDRNLAALIQELSDLDDAFRLVADVDDHLRRRHLEDGPLHDLAFRDVPEAVIVGLQEIVELGGVDLLVVVPPQGLEPAAVRTVFAVQSACTAPGRTGSVLVFNLRHAVPSPPRVVPGWPVIYMAVAGSIDCRRINAGADAPQVRVQRVLKRPDTPYCTA